MDKQNTPLLPSPLKQKRLNFNVAYLREDFKQQKHDELLMAIEDEINGNSACNLFDVILTDPLLNELNASLQKQAQLKKKNKLLESFPLRYQNLVHTETLYKRLQESLKVVQKESMEVKESVKTENQQLRALIQQLSFQIQEKNEQLRQLKECFQNEKICLRKQFQEIIASKDQQILIKLNETNDSERKLVKLKCEKDNLIEYLEEIKEQGQTLKKQNDRIIKVITSHELEINKLYLTIAENQELYKSNRQKFIDELTKVQLESKEKINIKDEECNRLYIQNQNLRNKLKEFQSQIVCLLNWRQAEQIKHNSQIEKLNTNLFEANQQSKMIQAELHQVREENKLKIEIIERNISQLSQSIANKDIEIEQKNLNCELELHKVRQINKKIADSKDETIQQMRQNINLVTEEKLFIQSKLLKLQNEKQSLINQIQKLKSDFDNHQKRIIEINFESKKNESKYIEIQMIKIQFKDQLAKFMDLIKQKDEKIQQYRKNIMNLRSKTNEAISEKQLMSQELEVYVNNNSILINQIDRLRAELNKCKAKENVLEQQIEGFQRFINKKKEEKETQFQVLEGFNDSEAVKLSELHKKLDKTQEKYENILEQLQQYKKQYKEEMLEKQRIINSLKNDNKNMKDLIGNKISQNTDISQLLNTKIEELKGFYEYKMVQEDKKYRTTIDVLKKEVIQLYKEIDLKKSMEEQMFNEIMKINKERKAKDEMQH